MPAPAAPEPRSHHPEEPVARAPAGALPGRAGENGKLVPQQEVLRHQLTVTAETRAKQNGNKEQIREHRPVRMLLTRAQVP